MGWTRRGLMFDQGDCAVAALDELEDDLLCADLVIDSDDEVQVLGESRFRPGGDCQASNQCMRNIDVAEVPQDLPRDLRLFTHGFGRPRGDRGNPEGVGAAKPREDPRCLLLRHQDADAGDSGA